MHDDEEEVGVYADFSVIFGGGGNDLEKEEGEGGEGEHVEDYMDDLDGIPWCSRCWATMTKHTIIYHDGKWRRFESNCSNQDRGDSILGCDTNERQQQPQYAEFWASKAKSNVNNIIPLASAIYSAKG